ncbi:MAG: hypothetical protein KIT51_04905 [Cyclobacteriaceae bacterium]|nr:MAG: hypothetical protein KIT51_04905 [Cyclobacteriaceae bacterium]
MNQDDKNLILIEFEYYGGPDDYKEFINELRESYQLVQARPVWLPAACEGNEMWLTVFINSPITEFIVVNAAWDLIKYGAKKLFLRPLFSSLDKLANQDNKTQLRLLKFKLQFDDTCIYIGGISKNFMSITGTIFQKLSVKMNSFIDEVGMPITRIDLPIHQFDRDGSIKYEIDTYHERTDTDYFLNLWKLTYQNGVECRIFDFKTDKFINCY